jgi:hypothetical protein
MIDVELGLFERRGSWGIRMGVIGFDLTLAPVLLFSGFSEVFLSVDVGRTLIGIGIGVVTVILILLALAKNALVV